MIEGTVCFYKPEVWLLSVGEQVPLETAVQWRPGSSDIHVQAFQSTDIEDFGLEYARDIEYRYVGYLELGDGAGFCHRYWKEHRRLGLRCNWLRFDLQEATIYKLVELGRQPGSYMPISSCEGPSLWQQNFMATFVDERENGHIRSHGEFPLDIQKQLFVLLLRLRDDWRDANTGLRLFEAYLSNFDASNEYISLLGRECYFELDTLEFARTLSSDPALARAECARSITHRLGDLEALWLQRHLLEAAGVELDRAVVSTEELRYRELETLQRDLLFRLRYPSTLRFKRGYDWRTLGRQRLGIDELEAHIVGHMTSIATLLAAERDSQEQELARSLNYRMYVLTVVTIVLGLAAIGLACVEVTLALVGILRM